MMSIAWLCMDIGMGKPIITTGGVTFEANCIPARQERGFWTILYINKVYVYVILSIPHLVSSYFLWSQPLLICRKQALWISSHCLLFSKLVEQCYSTLSRRKRRAVYR